MLYPANSHRALIGALAAITLVAGCAINWRASQRLGVDFRYVHAVAYSLVKGLDLYDDATRQPITLALYQGTLYGVPYPPSTGWVLLPFGLLSRSVGAMLWFMLNLGMLSIGLWAMMSAFMPQWTAESKLFAIGVVLCSSASRWCFLPLQSEPLVTGLLGLFLATTVHKHAAQSAILATLAICLKFTMGLPFLAIALLTKQYRVAVAAVALLLLLNLAGFARLGGMTAVRNYQANVARVEVTEPINDPDPHDPAAIMRTDWTFLLNLVAPNTPRNRVVAVLLTVALGAWVTVLALRIRSRVSDEVYVALISGPIVCLTLLVAYHHHYEALMLVCPLLLYVGAGNAVDRVWRRWFVWPVGLFFGLYAVNVVESFVVSHLGSGYLAVAKVASAVVVTVALAASVAMLARAAGERKDQVAELQLDTAAA